MSTLSSLFHAAIPAEGAKFERAPALVASRKFESQMIRLCDSLGTDRRGGECQVIQFIGVGTDHHTSSICLGLAHAAAYRNGLRVLLVEADPPGCDRDQLAGAPLDDADDDGEADEPAVARWPENERLLVTALWKRARNELSPPTPYRLYHLIQLRARFDLILIDSNRSAFSAEGQLIANMANGFVLVMNAQSASLDLATDTAKRLQGGGGVMCGVVLSGGTD